MAILTFADSATQEFFVFGRTRQNVGWRNLSSVVRRKLDMLHYAVQLIDLRSPPGNRLEQLKGQMSGMFSIRINDQWRIVFRWTPSGPTDVRICDYH